MQIANFRSIFRSMVQSTVQSMSPQSRFCTIPLLSHTHSLTRTLTPTHILTHTHTHSHSLTHSHTHSLTHSLIFSQNKSLQYIQQEDPDIFCLQETKCSEDDLPKVLTVCTLVVVTVCVSNCVHFCRNSEGYHSYWSSADQKGYSGTR